MVPLDEKESETDNDAYIYTYIYIWKSDPLYVLKRFLKNKYFQNEVFLSLVWDLQKNFMNYKNVKMERVKAPSRKYGRNNVVYYKVRYAFLAFFGFFSFHTLKRLIIRKFFKNS